jgi:hypothetical protein
MSFLRMKYVQSENYSWLGRLNIGLTPVQTFDRGEILDPTPPESVSSGRVVSEFAILAMTNMPHKNV